MRTRDVRAISFCVITTAGLMVLLTAITGQYVASLGLTSAYAAFILSRPRMIRVFRRLRGAPDWSGYFDNDRPSERSPSPPPVQPPSMDRIRARRTG